MDNQGPSIFSDKITLSTVLIQKIFTTITLYNNIFRKLRDGSVLKHDLVNDEDWKLCWQNVTEIYDYLEFQYINLLALKVDGKIEEGKILKEKLIRIINRYRTTNNVLTLEDLSYVYESVRYITTKVGLHNVDTYKTNKSRDMLEPEGDWFSW